MEFFLVGLEPSRIVVILLILSFLFSMRHGWVDVAPEGMAAKEELAREEWLERR